MTEKPRHVCSQCFGVMTNNEMGAALEYAASVGEDVRCRHCGTTHPNFIRYTDWKKSEELLMHLQVVSPETWARILKPAIESLGEHASLLPFMGEEE